MVEPVPRLYPSCAQCFPGLPGLAHSAVLLTPWPGSCSWHSLSFNPVACGLGLHDGSCGSAATRSSREADIPLSSVWGYLEPAP